MLVGLSIPAVSSNQLVPLNTQPTNVEWYSLLELIEVKLDCLNLKFSF